MDQKTIDEWEEDTPDKIPERLKKEGTMTKMAFRKGFEKKAGLFGYKDKKKAKRLYGKAKKAHGKGDIKRMARHLYDRERS